MVMRSLRHLRILFLLLAPSLHAAPKTEGAEQVECIGPSKDEARAFIVYLHGFEDPKKYSAEEEQNRALLLKMSKEEKIRIALVRGPLCPKSRLCWPAKDQKEVLQSFAHIQKAKNECFREKPYTLVGFSNGGYYAFKLWKIHEDKELTKIIASSSSGLWDGEKEKPNALSTFALMIGDSDITRSKAEAFMKNLKKKVPSAEFRVFKGGHRLDETTLKELLAKEK